jgi:hypothetical protein
MHMPLRVLLAALTLFGGHVLNRRLDRIVLVFALLAVLGSMYLVGPSLMFSAGATDLVPTAFHAASLLLIAIAVISAALTWKDARAPALPPLSLTSRLAGGTVSLFGLLMIAFAAMLLLASPGGKHSSRESVRSSAPARFGNTMYASTHLGGNIRYEELQPPPAGAHPLRGRIVMAGRPAVAATVELILNEAFRSESLITNAQGEFEIRLPAGPWTLNQVTVTQWPDAPADKELLLFSEYEPLKDSGYYSRVNHDASALRIDLPAAPHSKPPTFELREAIAMQWPTASAGTPSEPSEAPEADPATAIISWERVPGAAEYEIQLQSVKREHRTLSTRTVLLRHQSGTQLRLVDLPKQHQPATAREYSVAVYAFDASGKVLSQTRDGFNHYAFVLDGEIQLAEEGVYRSSPIDGTERLRDVERLSLVSSLLEYKQVDAARAILEEVTDNAPPGRKAAMQGAIEALAGNCDAAIPLLDRADQEGGLGCAPAKYRAMCPGSR